MIFVSSACVKNKYMVDSIKELANEGYKNIELSGGTIPYDNLEADLVSLKKEYGLNYLCHNYFPPPSIPFVINLASLDKETHQLTIANLEKAISISKLIKGSILGFHAGFLLNIPLSQIGKPIKKAPLFEREESMKLFIQSVKNLQSKFSDIKLYIENNVLSKQNYINFNKENPFFLCESNDYLNLSNELKFNLLLDVAHLKVSSKTLGLNFANELDTLIPKSDYIHISDNNGTADSNKPFYEDSALFKQLSKYDFKEKTITIEVYGTLEDVKTSYLTAQKLM